MSGFGGGIAAQAPPAPGGAPTTAKAQALIDLTGYWVSIVNEDWRWRMMTPAKGDYASVPLNAEGKRVADTWDPVKDEREGNQCRAYGAGNIMRIPERLHITWENDNTLRMDTDAGMQTRLFHFDGSKWQGGAPQWQGDSVAAWEKQVQSGGAAGQFGGPEPGKGGTLHVVTTHMKPGYLRKNGVPYSGNAVLTEYFDRFDRNGNSYLIVTSVVDDPQYLNDRFIISGQFKREPDGSKWNPTPCRPLWPGSDRGCPTGRPAAAQAEASRVAVNSDDIGGVVTSSKGPEAGVWVIAETTDLPTKFRKIVVTDDAGRYLLPELPKATYKVWVRGYGLVDSKAVEATPGKTLALTAVIAPNARAAAQYYPGDYWYSLLKIPPKSAFPMKVRVGGGPTGHNPTSQEAAEERVNFGGKRRIRIQRLSRRPNGTFC
jgi:hypothetical protein